MSVDESPATVEADRPTPAPRFLPLETISVRLSLPEESETDRRRPAFGIVANMSVTGCNVITNRGLPVGTAVELAIVSARRKEVLKVTVRVVWCAERLEPIKEIIGYLTGVAFRAEDSAPIADLLMSGLFQPIP